MRRGDLSGCSFAFTTHYWDSDFVGRKSEVVNGRSMITYTVKGVTGVYDFTLAADPAYADTSVEARELVTGLREAKEAQEPKPDTEKMREQVREMRRAAAQKIF